jgi:hypothetical protein
MKVDYMKPSTIKNVAIKNKTTRTLSNGIVIPTWTAMVREIAKI